MNFFKKLKLVYKIQFGFFLIALISSLIAFNDVYQINTMQELKTELNSLATLPKKNVDEAYLEYQQIQFIMLKLSIHEFADNFRENVKSYNVHKTKFDTLINQPWTKNLSVENQKSINEVKQIWEEYKNIVADAIISASASQTYDMAIIIATTSGVEVGNKIDTKFNDIKNKIANIEAGIDTEFEQAQNNSIKYLIIGMIIGTIVFMITVFYLAPTISKPIKNLQSILAEFTLGNFNVDIKNNRQDEFGDLYNMAEKVKHAQLEKISAAEKIAEGSLEKVTEASEKDILAKAFNKEVMILENLLEEIDNVIAANERGDLSSEVNVSEFSGGWARILDGLKRLRETTKAPLNEASDVLRAMASGDFRNKMQGSYQGEYENIKNDINAVIDSLNEIIGNVKVGADDLASSAEQITGSVAQMTQGADEQNTQTFKMVSSIEEMTNTITDSTQNANLAASKAQTAGDTAQKGGRVVEQTIEGINKIAEIVISSVKTIEELGKSSDQIGDIILVINEIADQTNLLALNAAIEAARAGEHGRGFAVVADEVKKLAERTTNATNEISGMISRIQSDTSGAIAAIEKGKEEVQVGKDLAGDAGNALTEIISITEEVEHLINQLAAASEEQNATSKEISTNIEMVSQVTYQTSENTNQISEAAKSLNSLTENMLHIVGQFKLRQQQKANYQENKFIKNKKRSYQEV